MSGLPCFLLGPTASGKSEAGILLAEAAGCEILSLDAMAVYRGMDVATAKPDAETRRRVPHHGIDLVDPAEEFHLKAFLDLARNLLAAPGKRVLGLVGTGYYLHRLRAGLFEGPGADWALRGELEARGTEALREELSRRDPQAAAAIPPGDRRRAIRALEVVLATGRPLSAWQKEGTRGGLTQAVLLGIRRERADLVARIERRADAMFAAGLVEETRRLAASGLSRSASQALGTKEVLGYLKGDYGLEAATELVKRRTRQFAKRQMTWFRRFPDVRWVDAGPEEPADILTARLLGALREAEAALGEAA